MKTIGIILAGGNNEGRLEELTASRAAAAMPIGGCHRAIDFTLSNMSNSGIRKVAVLTQYNARSLRDHLTSSKWWDFGRKQGGLFVFTPYTSNTDSTWFRGTADSIYQNMAFLKRSNSDYVIIASGDSIYKMDYRAVLEYHAEKGADITVVYQRMEDDLSRYGVVEVTEDGRLTGFEEKPEEPKTDCASLGIYVVCRKRLIEILNRNIPEGKYDLVKDIIIEMKDELKIYGYEFSDYWRTISTGVSAYFRVNMDFLNRDIMNTFMNEYPYIETKAKDEPPVKYNLGAEVVDSIAGSGSIFNGKVEHSVIFRKVYTAEDSLVQNSVILEGCRIGKGCIVRNAILDKNVILSDGIKVIGDSSENPIIIPKGAEL